MGMVRALVSPLALSILLCASAAAQLSGTRTINSAGGADYLSLAAAINDLNTFGVGPGGVVFNVAAGHVETAANLVITDSTASEGSPVSFLKSGGGANPLITAGAGTGTTDGIIKIAGTDWLTFDGIDLAENPANTTTTLQMEWGYIVAKANGGNGAHHVTIRNCSIALNKSNPAATGIYQANHRVNSTTALVVTSFSGTNSDNRYYANAITNVTAGIATNGYADTAPWSLYDRHTAVGVEGGNTITNFGGGSTACYGIYALYQDSLTIANNVVNGGTGTSGAMYGIDAATGFNASVEITGNTVSLFTNAAATNVYGIANAMGGSSGTPGTTNRVRIAGNIIENMALPGMTTGSVFGIYQTAAPADCEITGNIVRNTSRGGTGQLCLIEQGGAVADSAIVTGNQVLNNTGAGAFLGLYATTTGPTVTVVTGNTVLNNATTSAAASYLLQIAGGMTTLVGQNTLATFSAGGGGLYGIHHASSVAGMSARIDRNEVFDLQNSGAGATIHGIFIQSGAGVSVTNNMISDLRAPTGSHATAALTGLYIAGGGTVGAYHNTVLLKGSSASSTFGTSGIYATTGVTADLRNNTVVNLSVPGVTAGTVAAYRRSSTLLTSYAAASDANDWYAGVPAAKRLIFSDGTNNDSTLAAFQSRVSPRDARSVTENPPFVNGATTPYDLHIDVTMPTELDSGGVPVTSPIAVTQDFDGDPRDPVYPDIGADEFHAPVPDMTPPAISYAPLGTVYDSTDRSLTATITDTGGVAAGPSGPRLYYKKTTGPSWVFDASPSLADSSYSFVIDYALVGGVVSGDTIEYYAAAQDSSGNAATFPAGGSGSNPPGTVPPPAPDRYTVLLIPPGPASVVAPPDFGTDIAVVTNLEWAAPPPGPPLSGYRLSFGTDNPPTNILNGVDVGNVPAYDPAGDLAFGTTYYWQVVPYNSFGNATGCPVWRFTTVPDPTITLFPYVQSFDTSLFPPYGWVPDGTKPWIRSTTGFRTAPACAAVAHDPAGTAILQMPPVNLPPLYCIRFWWRDNDNGAGPEVAGHDTTFFEVSTSGGSSWTVLASLSSSVPDPAYHEEVVNLDAFAGNGVWMRWRDVSDGTVESSGAGLDDIRMEPITAGVTFRVNMKTAMEEWRFRPDLGDQVTVRGSFNGWGDPPFDNPDTLRDADNDSVYSLTKPLPPGAIAYRFWKTERGGTGYEPVPDRQADIGLVPVALPAVYFGDDTTVAVSFGVGSGWNVVCRPVVSETDSVVLLFPGSVFPYVFGFDPFIGYRQERTMELGRGYWGKFSGNQQVEMRGTYVVVDSIAVSAGWNMIGSISVPVDTASVLQIPPGIISSSFFGYQGGYAADSVLTPGKAYWVKANASGTIVLQSATTPVPPPRRGGEGFSNENREK